MVRLNAALWLTLIGQSLLGQANGKLQIHFMDVGQGDGAVLISPQGQVVLFDGGNAKDCAKPVQYLAQLGILHPRTKHFTLAARSRDLVKRCSWVLH